MIGVRTMSTNRDRGNRPMGWFHQEGGRRQPRGHVIPWFICRVDGDPVPQRSRRSQ